MRAMTETPEEPGAQGADTSDLDPEDAPVELDEEGFLVESGHGRQFPTDLDVWARWAGAVVVGVAAFETLGYLISSTLLAWDAGMPDVPLPRPDGYFSLLLLTGVLLLVLGRRPGADPAGPAWAKGAACLAAGVAGSLVVTQLAGNIGAIVHPSGEGYEPAAYSASAIVSGIGGLADAVPAALAAVLAVLLYRWLRAAPGPVPALEDGQETVPEAPSEEGATSTEPSRRPGGSVGPAVAALLLGAVVAIACLFAFDLGIRNQPDAETGLLTTRGTPVVSAPFPTGGGVTDTINCSSPIGRYSPFCAVPTASPSPSPAP